MVTRALYSAWKIIAKNNFQNQLLTPSSSFLFIIGKILNFAFTVFTIFAVFHQTNSINGYSLNQAVIVVLLFNLIDTTVQFFFRSIYSFRPILIKGDFDFDLLKPLPTFFRPLLSGPDFLDLPLVVIKLGVLIYFMFHYSISMTVTQIFLSIFLIINAFVVSFAVHLAIAAFSILTTEIDNLISMYRSLGQAAIIPTDIYRGVLRFVLDFIIPYTVIVTIPAKSILGILHPSNIIFSCLVTYGFLIFSINLWNYSLRHYTSASS